MFAHDSNINLSVQEISVVERYYGFEFSMKLKSYLKINFYLIVLFSV